MTSLFQLLPLSLSAYGLYGMVMGSVYAKSGLRMEKITREDAPRTFWFICVMYLVMGQVMFWALEHYLRNHCFGRC